ncbi:MAG: type II toxin-antitoxin system VapC family toxin [Myxococcales bacterium]|nr:type II toxin-antitoxin system VapC family toxin [Myxococcales bacterium]
METLIHLDTHVVAWLYSGDRARLRPVWRTLGKSELAISPAVLLELQYLYEIGRVAAPAETVRQDLVERIGLCLAATAFPQVVGEALRQSWTRDPFDRLIVAQAIVEKRRLLTADENIQKHCHAAYWR